MGIKKFRPTTPSRRHMATPDYSEITKAKPERSLVVSLSEKAGRNKTGRITMRSRGGRGRINYRRIDFTRDKLGVPGKVVSIEYDPNRSARIALISYLDGEKRYIIAPVGLTVGDSVVAGKDSIRPGNALLKIFPWYSSTQRGASGRGGVLVRSAGASAQLMAKEGNMHLSACQAGTEAILLNAWHSWTGRK